MLVVEQHHIDETLLTVKCNYSQDYNKRFRKVPGTHFDGKLKSWIIPVGAFDYFEDIFRGEIVYKTPRWVILDEPKPDYSKMYQVPNVSLPKLKATPYNYQNFGIKFMIDRIQRYGFVINADDVGLGKCHGKGTKILMYSGEIKNVEDVNKDELLMGDDGTPRKVLSLANGKEQMYKITLTNGDYFTCNESHILALTVSKGNRYKKYRSGDKVNLSVKEYLQLPDWVKDKVFKMYKNPVNFGSQDVIVPAYLYGAWLGDGSCNRLNFTINDIDIEIVEYITRYADSNGFQIRSVKGRGCHTYCLHKGTDNSLKYPELNIIKESSYNGKHILREYLINGKDVRLQLLAGLLDTDGHLIDNCYEICTKFEQLKDDILFLCRSLGFSVSHGIKIIDDVVYYRIYISGNTHTIPCKTRKKASERLQKKNPLIYGFTVDQLGVGDYYGFNIDGNHLYLLGDFTVTHNTLQAVGTMQWLIRNAGTKRILIVCKKSLKRQWAVDGIMKFTNHFPMVTDKDKKHRKKQYDVFKTAGCGIMITNYHTVMNDKEKLKELDFELVIIDEAHVVKARTGEINNALQSVVKLAKHCMFLTGTPIMSRPEDIFGIVQIYTDKFFGKWAVFEKLHIKRERQGRFFKVIGAMNLDLLRDKVQDIIIRRTEHEVDLELPSVITQQIMVPIDNTQQKILDYLDERKHKLSQTMAKAGDDLRAQLEKAMKGYTSGYQAVANDPRLFLMSKSQKMREDCGQLIPASYTMSSKTEATIEVLEDIISSGQKAIVFTKFERGVRLLAEDITKALKCQVVTYSGKIDDDVRDDNIDLFKIDDDVKVLICNDAAAEGLNLQIANHIIHYDQPDTPGIKIQRTGRARRIGSKYKTVHEYDIITENSKDIERLKNLERLGNLVDGVISVNGAQSEALIKAMEE